MDERIILDDEHEPSGSPLGLIAALAIVAAAIAVIALRPSDVNPNSLSASPPTTLFVPPEAVTTTLPARSLQSDVPGLRGALHFDVVTPQGRQLWVWNATADRPTIVDVPGPVDISANRRFALSTSENQAGEGVVWLGPKLDLRPAAIVPGLTGAVWHRSESELLLVTRNIGTATELNWWTFSGVGHEQDRSMEISGSWEPVFLTETTVGLQSTDSNHDFGRRSLIVDAATGAILHEFEGRMWSTTGPPVVYECHNIACTSSTIGWVEGDEFIVSPRPATIFPSSSGDLVAASRRLTPLHVTEVMTRDGQTIMEVPLTGEVGAWSGDSRFFVFAKTESGFDDVPTLVFLDVVEQAAYQVQVPGSTDWFVTDIWYGP